MAKMKEDDLLTILNTGVQDTTAFDSVFMTENENLLERYLGKPYGNELPNRSSVISNDVMDVVESDLPPLAKIFLGSGDVLKFKPNKSSDPDDVKEADQKTKYVNWQIRDQDWSFPTLLGWIKNTEIQKTGVVKYFIEETTEVEEHRKEGLSPVEMAMFEESLQGEDVRSIEISERGEEDEEGRFEVVFKVEKTRKQVKIRNIPIERFLITRNAESKNDAMMVGDIEETTRGELLSRGFPRSLVDQIPLAGSHADTAGGAESTSSTTSRSRMEDIRDADEGGAHNDLTFSDWALEEVEIQDLYPMVDYDQDGIAERRHIIRGGDVILLNEVFNHVPYAIMSSIIMPHKAIGRSRAEITMPTAEAKTAILRGIQDNIYSVNAPSIAANKNVVMDDLLSPQRPNRVLRTKGESNPGQNMFAIETPYIGDKALQVIQYWDQARAKTTGSQMNSQGLNADDLGKETATRFEGVADEGAMKVGLVARTIAETGFRDLYQGVAWLNSNFQNSEVEIEVLGEELTVNPADWKYSHSIKANVGLGVGDDEATLATMSGLLQISQQLKATGSPLTDEVKVYNMLDRVVKASSLPDTSEFFNDPNKPEQLLKAENEILNQVVQQQQEQLQQLQNPLAEAETIKAQARLVEEERKRELDVAQMLEDQRQFNATMLQKQNEMDQKIALKLTELEQQSNKDLSKEFKQNEQQA